jgi:integrase
MTAVAKIEVPYVNAYKDRHKRQRYYYRRKGYRSIALPDQPGSEAFAAAYQLAEQTGKIQPKEGARSLGAMIDAYYASLKWAALSPVTQKGHRSVLEGFRKVHGHRPAATTTSEHLDRVFNSMSKTPARAANLRKRLRAVFAFGAKNGWIKRGTNPVTDTDKVTYKVTGFEPWTDDDIAAFEAKWPAGSRERLALYLLLYTGQRRSDVVKMGRQHIKDGRISVVQQKTDKRLLIKLHPALKAEIERAPIGMTLLLTQWGKPFSAAGFTAWFVARAKDAELEGKSPHGLRKAAGRRLAEVGCSAKVIAAVLGHSTLAMVTLYTQDADQILLADEGINALDRVRTGNENA